jgi:hypothetical protein
MRDRAQNVLPDVNRRASLAVLLALGLIGLSLLAARNLGDGPSELEGPADADRPEGAAERPLGAAPVLISGAEPHAPPAAREPADVEPSRLVAPGRLRVRGRVRGATKPIPARTWVFVTTPRRPRQVLAQQTATPEGTFDLDVPAPEGSPPWDLRVGALAAGRMRADQGIQGRPGESLEVELVLPDEGSLEGHVRDSSGRPVPGLRIQFMASPPMSYAFDPRPAATTDPEEVLTRSRDDLMAWTTTDGEGRYEVWGLEHSASWPLSADADWHVQTESGGFVLAPGVADLVATPAIVLEGAVTDAATGRVFESLQRTITVRRGERSVASYGHGGAHGALWFQQGLPADSDDLLEVVVDLDAFGYRPASVTVPFARGERRKRIDVALVPLRAHEMGRLVLDTGLRDDEGRNVGAQVSRWIEHGNSRMGYGLRVERDASGGASVVLPEGESNLGIQPECPFGALLTWSGPVSIRGGVDTPFTPPWPPHGSVRIRVSAPPGDPPHVRLTLDSFPPRQTATYDGPIGPNGILAPAVPAGRWRVRSLLPLDVPVQEFVVEAGRVTDVVVDR